ncbi:phosphopantetheine-binding protein [Nonomuraea jabiensis]|uniref:phosphopantetheine-binding protein n=1 Tax=Nonomuraea jabiensis TaxID=882448 RepID=UPI003D71B74A
MTRQGDVQGLDAVHVAPRSEIDSISSEAESRASGEKIICDIFADLLNTGKPVGTDDDFFTLGGNSLLVMRLISRLRAELNVEVDIRVLFENPTAGGIAKLLSTAPTARPALKPRPKA